MTTKGIAQSNQRISAGISKLWRAPIAIMTVITPKPPPVARHSFFSSYLAFSILSEVLYPAIRKAPLPHNKITENVANKAMTIQMATISIITPILPLLGTTSSFGEPPRQEVNTNRGQESFTNDVFFFNHITNSHSKEITNTC